LTTRIKWVIGWNVTVEF